MLNSKWALMSGSEPHPASVGIKEQSPNGVKNGVLQLSILRINDECTKTESIDLEPTPAESSMWKSIHRRRKQWVKPC